jgi:hypothetical protein
MRTTPDAPTRWTRVAIDVGSSLFIVALAGSAFVVPQLRVLHLLQALIYVAIIILSRRNRPEVFGAAIAVAIAWNSLNLFITHLTQAGTREFWSLLTTGQVRRIDTMMVALGSLGHFILIVACVAGFHRLRRRPGAWWRLGAGAVAALAYLALIIVAAAPR